MRWLLLVALVAGCGRTLPSPSYHPNRDDADTLAAVETAWRGDTTLPAVGERCEEEKRRFRIAVLDDAQFVRTCPGYCAPGHCPGYRASNDCPNACAGECYTNHCWGSWPHCWGDQEFLGGSSIPLVTIHESKLADWGWQRTLLHGAIHFYEDCTGLGRSNHREPRLWGLDGVRARAAAALRLQ